ncbi:MAG: hypothetical protein U0Q15_11020 [Kineosporiaceae bacterium]
MSVSVRLSEQVLSLPPGGTAVVVVTVANTSTIVEHYTVEAVRLPAGLSARASGVPVQLSVGEQAEVPLTVTAATAPPPASGATMVGVMVSSPHRLQVRRVEELTVEVQPAPAFTAVVEPPSARGRRRGEVDLVLRNPGNAPLDVDLTARDPQRKVRVELGTSRVSLPPGGSAHVTAALSGRPVLMGKAVRHQVAFSAQPVAVPTPARGLPAGYPVAPAQPLPPWTGQAEFVQEPVLAPGLVRAVGAAFGVVTLAGVVGVGSIMVRGRSRTRARTSRSRPPRPLPRRAVPRPQRRRATVSASPSAPTGAATGGAATPTPTAGGTPTASPSAVATTIDFTAACPPAPPTPSSSPATPTRACGCPHRRRPSAP